MSVLQLQHLLMGRHVGKVLLELLVLQELVGEQNGQGLLLLVGGEVLRWGRHATHVHDLVVVLELELLGQHLFLHLGELEDVAARGVNSLEVLIELLLLPLTVGVLVAQITFLHMDTTNRLRQTPLTYFSSTLIGSC